MRTHLTISIRQRNWIYSFLVGLRRLIAEIYSANARVVEPNVDHVHRSIPAVYRATVQQIQVRQYPWVQINSMRIIVRRRRPAPKTGRNESKKIFPIFLNFHLIHFSALSVLSTFSPRKLRGTRTSASLKVRGLLGRVWARDSKSKSCENLHVL